MPNAASTRAHGINARGQIVGRYIDSSGHHHGFLLSADGTTFTTIDPNIAGFSNISKIAARGNEGVMAKAPGSAYTPGRRGQSWLKLKRPLATLDVVVTAVEYGHGKRHGLLSDYTFSVRSDEGNRLVTIGKAYSGLTDAEIADLTEYFKGHTLADRGFRREVEPTVVMEVAFNNIQRSSRHQSGYALRFPRIVRLRPDKPVEEIDNLGRVKELYRRSPGVASNR